MEMSRWLIQLEWGTEACCENSTWFLLEYSVRTANTCFFFFFFKTQTSVRPWLFKLTSLFLLSNLGVVHTSSRSEEWNGERENKIKQLQKLIANYMLHEIMSPSWGFPCDWIAWTSNYRSVSSIDALCTGKHKKQRCAHIGILDIYFLILCQRVLWTVQI